MTPCEKKGYKVGDRFVVRGSVAFDDGSVVELQEDDESDTPLFKLVSGDTPYNLDYGKPGAYADLSFVNKIEASDDTPQWTGEGLPPVGVEILITGTLTGTEAPGVVDYIDERHCIWRWMDDTDTMHNYVHEMRFRPRPLRTDEDRAVEDLIDVISSGRDGRQSVKAHLAAERVVNAGYRKHPTEDLTDPANWREGDVVECCVNYYSGFRKGFRYEVKKISHGGRIGVINDSNGGLEMRMAKNFRFHHRP